MRRLLGAVFGLTLLLFYAGPAFAGDGRDALTGDKHEPVAVKAICLDPASGEERGTKPGGACPDGQTAYLSYEIERGAGADPEAFETEIQGNQDGAADALSDRE